MLLELEGVNAYYDKSHVLQNVSLAIDEGEVVALLGRNGSGRSTTCKTIMGIVQAKTGTMRFKGQPITNKTPFALAQLGIAFVPEDRRIFPNLTVGENLRLVCGKSVLELNASGQINLTGVQINVYSEGSSEINTGGNLHLNIGGKGGTTPMGQGVKGDIDAAVNAMFPKPSSGQ